MSSTRHVRIVLLLAWLGTGGIIFFRSGLAAPDSSVPGCLYPLGISTPHASWVECLPRTDQPLGRVAQRVTDEAVRRCLEHEGRIVRAGERVRIGVGCALSFERLPFRNRFVLGLPLDINRAGLADLQLLPGIGLALARRIVARRERLGRFVSWRQLRAVRGLGPASIGRLQRAGQFELADE